MSRETQHALENRFLIGFTAERGHAWHWRGIGNNHFEHEVPLERVRELLDFEVTEEPVIVRGSKVENRKAIVADDTGDVFGIFSDGYTPHQPTEWLLDQVETLLDDTLRVAGVGLPRNRAQAYVQVEMPETVRTPEGEAFRPYVTASTSFDGTLATKYGTGMTRIVCDNTHSVFWQNAGHQLSFRHTANSVFKKAEVADALAIVHTLADDFSRNITEMCNTSVNASQWSKFLDVVAPVPQDATGASLTRAVNRRDAINGLWNADERVAPWSGTAWGVISAMNTFEQHMTSIKGGDGARIERNAVNWLRGSLADKDAQALSALRKVGVLA